MAPLFSDVLQSDSLFAGKIPVSFSIYRRVLTSLDWSCSFFTGLVVFWPIQVDIDQFKHFLVGSVW